jgi:hypothetical protein
MNIQPDPAGITVFRDTTFLAAGPNKGASMQSQRSLFLSSLVGVLLSVAPCPAQDKPDIKVVIPATKKVKAIHIEIYKTAKAEGYKLKLMDEKSVEPVLDWLKSIDFDPAKGRDGKAIKLAHFGSLEILTRDGKSQYFGLADQMIDGGWLWPADTDKLLKVLKKAKGK